MEAIERAAAAAPWVRRANSPRWEAGGVAARRGGSPLGAADLAADFREALYETYPRIRTQAAADEASLSRRLRRHDVELAAEKRAIEMHVRAFWDVLDARHEVLLRGAEHRAARQAEVDNVAAYLARLLELSISLSATERRLRSAAAAERRGATPADHEARVRADAAALVGLVSEQERLADTCPICYDLLGGDSPAAEVRPRIRCGHRFHAHCLAGWKESCHAGGRTPSCPLCRGPLTSPTATARALWQY